MIPCLAFFSCFKSPISLSSYLGSSTFSLPLLVCCTTAIILLSCLISAPISKSLAILLLFSVLGLTSSYLAFTAFKTLKQALLNKLFYYSTSSAKFFDLFLFFCSLPDKTNCKRIFDIVLINSRLLASNYTWEKVNLSFAKCSCLARIKLNWLWSLEFLDFKLIYIIEAILLIAAIFEDLSFAPCYYYTVKLALKLGLII